MLARRRGRGPRCCWRPCSEPLLPALPCRFSGRRSPLRICRSFCCWVCLAAARSFASSSLSRWPRLRRWHPLPIWASSPPPVDRDRRACDRGGGSLCLASGNRRPAGIDEPARMAEKLRFQPAAFASNLVLRGVIWALLSISYFWRIPLAGWVVSRILSPVAGYGKRVRANLALIFPDMPQAEVARMVRAVPDNAGRTLVEVYSGAEFKAKVADSRITGAGLSAILQARDRGQGVILVSGHFGNYDVPRAVLSARGLLVGALYKPFSNPFFDKHYRRTISAIGTPIFPRGRRGLAEMVQHLRAGGLLGILIDQSIEHGAPLTFFGRS